MATATIPEAAPVASGMPGEKKWRQALIGWSFVVPFVLVFAVFLVGPIVVSFITSFTDMRVTDIRNPLNVNFVGLENYADVLGDPTFRKAAWNTAIYVLLTIPLTMGLGLLAAVALNQAILKFRNLFRVGYFLPYVTAVIAIAVVWRFLLGEEDGVINGLLSIVGIEGPGWLTDTRYALGSIVVMTAWRGLGLQMIIFLAGLQAIPADMYEAAQVDGAGTWQRFWRITFPLLRPTMLFSAVIAGIGLMQAFDEIYVMTQGGPLDATLTVAFHAYRQFSFGNYGYTAAAAYLLFLAIVALTLLQFRIFRSKT
jgi:multiple sugar transport system permease protein